MRLRTSLTAKRLIVLSVSAQFQIQRFVATESELSHTNCKFVLMTTALDYELTLVNIFHT